MIKIVHPERGGKELWIILTCLIKAQGETQV